jgi:hypothetical protein
MSSSSFLFVLVASTLSFACASQPAPRVDIVAPIAHTVAPVTHPRAAATVGLIVGLSGTRSMDDVAADLARAGFKVDAKLDHIEMITGRGSVSAIERLQKISGVKFVEVEQLFEAA